MIKLTISELLNAAAAIKSLSPQKLSGVATLRIRRMAAKLGPDICAAEQARNTLLNPENSVALDGGTWQVKPAHVAAFLAAPLFAEVIEVDVLPLTSADIADARISKDELDLLGPLFVDDGFEPKSK